MPAITTITISLTTQLILVTTDQQLRINPKEMVMMSISLMESKCHPMLCSNTTKMKTTITTTIIIALDSPLHLSLKSLNSMCILPTTTDNPNNNYLTIFLNNLWLLQDVYFDLGLLSSSNPHSNSNKALRKIKYNRPFNFLLLALMVLSKKFQLIVQDLNLAFKLNSPMIVLKYILLFSHLQKDRVS